MITECAVLQSTSGQQVNFEGVVAQGRIDGLLFELSVEQRYRNPSDTNLEVVYTFPIPSDAVLLDVEVELGEKKLRAVAVEKKQAERRYEEAIEQSNTAMMIERAGDGLCTLNLGNLNPFENAVIHFRYAQLLRYEHGSVRMAIPTVIAPRYGSPADSGMDPHQVPKTDMSVEYPFEVSIDLMGDIANGELTSPSHEINISPLDGGRRVSLADEAWLDRDFVLNVDGLTGKSLTTTARDGDQFVTLTSFCADVPPEVETMPLRVKLLVDCSGSMSGDSIRAARRALQQIFQKLTPSDEFSYSRFGSRVVHETKSVKQASEQRVQDSIQRLRQLKADLGGTEMASALRKTFALGGKGEAADVLLITDGEIWNADQLIEEAVLAGQRVFVVGIGSAPAEGVLSRLAETSGGACEFIAPKEDTEGAILRMFARLRAPRIASATVTWPVQPKWTTPLPKSLFGGETIHALSGFDKVPSGEVSLEMRPNENAAPLRASARLSDSVVDGNTLSRVAAAKRIVSAKADQQLHLALSYGLMTERTNLLVIHERAAEEKPDNLPELAQVAQMHAAGWHGIGAIESNCLSSSILELQSPDLDESVMFMRRTCSTRFKPRSKVFAPDIETKTAADFLKGVDKVFRSKLRKTDQSWDGVPRNLNELSRYDLPDVLLDVVTRLIANGHAEADAVCALLEALYGLVDSGAIKVRLSRHLGRALRNLFDNESQCKELRESVRTRIAVMV